MSSVVFSAPASRQGLREIPVAMAGSSGRPKWARDPDGTSGIVLLDRNECRDPELNAFVRQMLNMLPANVTSDYPEAGETYEKLAGFLGVSREKISLFAGSEAAIRAVFETYISPGDAVVVPTPSYVMLPAFCGIYGARQISIDYAASNSGPRLAATAIVDAITTQQPRLVYVANPNSPTGTILNSSDMERVIETAGRVGAVILVDEAYYYFNDQTVLPWLDRYPHLIVSRTFSKAWGMAGVRVGMLAASPTVMADIVRVRPLIEVSSVGYSLLDRMIDRFEQVEQSVQRLLAGKRYFVDEMKKLGFYAQDTAANFCFVAFGERTAAVTEALQGKAYFRPLTHPAVAGFMRVTATTREVFEPIVRRIARATTQG